MEKLNKKIKIFVEDSLALKMVEAEDMVMTASSDSSAISKAHTILTLKRDADITLIVSESFREYVEFMLDNPKLNTNLKLIYI